VSSNDKPTPKRSLIMAGGGLKVAFQAGVLQVWLDEAGLEFDHADGASGGTFNLAMYCQGMSGTEIADNWRGLPVLRGVGPNWLQYFKLYFAESVFTYERWRKNIFPHWGLDWARITASEVEATFNLYNFSRHRLEVREPAEMSEDALVSCVSLPIWFPPVRLGSDLYIDAVYASDANLIEAVKRGADELWIIWTVSNENRWNNGFLANYFQIIEAAANGRLNADIARIEENNALVAGGRPSEFGRHIDIRMLEAEVPLHYVINFSSRRFTEAVDLGVRYARDWCREQGIPLGDSGGAPARETTPVYLTFTEEMKGHVTAGADDYQAGTEGADRVAMRAMLAIEIDDVDAFIADSAREARVKGTIESPLAGGERAIAGGTFNLFVESDSGNKVMRYRLPFTAADGRVLTLQGVKRIRDDPGVDLWTDTTLLYTDIRSGEATGGVEGPLPPPLARGTIRIHLVDFLEQLKTFRTRGGSHERRAHALNAFGTFFLGALWNVYRR
jgi:predicted acylesterase/phospholipase RssA